MNPLKCGVCKKPIDGVPTGNVVTRSGIVVTCSSACNIKALTSPDACTPTPARKSSQGSPGFGFDPPPSTRGSKKKSSATTRREFARAIKEREAMVEEATLSRSKLIDPNRGSKIKICRYSLALPHHRVKLNEPSDFETEGYCRVEAFRPDELLVNVSCPGMVYAKEISLGNLLTTVGRARDGKNADEVQSLAGDTPEEKCWTDCYQAFSNVDWPTIMKTQPVILKGWYSGHFPAGYSAGNGYLLTFTLKGWATLC